jgi:hypothetical protein
MSEFQQFYLGMVIVAVAAFIAALAWAQLYTGGRDKR